MLITGGLGAAPGDVTSKNEKGHTLCAYRGHFWSRQAEPRTLLGRCTTRSPRTHKVSPERNLRDPRGRFFHRRAKRPLNVRNPLLVFQAQWRWRSTREGRARKGRGERSLTGKKVMLRRAATRTRARPRTRFGPRPRRPSNPRPELGSELRREIPDFVVFTENFGNSGFWYS